MGKTAIFFNIDGTNTLQIWLKRSVYVSIYLEPTNMKFFCTRATSLAAIAIQNFAKMPFFEKHSWVQTAISRLLLGLERPDFVW